MNTSVTRPKMVHGVKTMTETEKPIEKTEVAELRTVRWALG